jgi:Na+:H+ antiporter, NhaA family
MMSNPLGAATIVSFPPKLGLFIGKQFGVFGFSFVAIRSGSVDLPANSTWLQLYGVSLLCGFGFTMSLFIGLLAFPASPELQDATKIGVLLGSVISGAVGALLLRLTRPEPVGIYLSKHHERPSAASVVSLSTLR